MKALMVKVNDRYVPEFQTITKICEDGDGRRFAVKKPLGQAARTHIRQMQAASTALKDVFEGLSVLPCSMEEDAAVFPFIEGRTLLERMVESIRQSKEAFLALWDAYVADIRPKEAYTCPFVSTPEFERFFGDGSAFAGLPAYTACSLDMLPSNIMVRPDGQSILYDYEWLMRVPVPAALVLFAAAHFCVEGRSEFAPAVSLEELMARAGVAEDETVLRAALAHFHSAICREGPGEPTVEEVYDRYRKPAHDPAFFESEYYRLLTQLRAEEKERLSIIDGWNREHAHALEIDRDRMSLKAEQERLLDQAEQQQAEISRREAREQALHAELDEAGKREQALHDRFRCVMDKEDELHVMLHERNMEKYDLIGRLCWTQSQLEEALRECETMRQSTSWRMTEIFRRAGAFVRRLLRRG